VRRLDESTAEADIGCAELGIRELDASLIVARAIAANEKRSMNPQGEPGADEPPLGC
jgi:hypothetical protein